MSEKYWAWCALQRTDGACLTAVAHPEVGRAFEALVALEQLVRVHEAQGVVDVRRDGDDVLVAQAVWATRPAGGAQ